MKYFFNLKGLFQVAQGRKKYKYEEIKYVSAFLNIQEDKSFMHAFTGNKQVARYHNLSLSLSQGIKNE